MSGRDIAENARLLFKNTVQDREVPEFEFAWVYEPCDELGGDILNVFELDDKHLGLYLLDVSGHSGPRNQPAW